MFALYTHVTMLGPTPLKILSLHLSMHVQPVPLWLKTESIYLILLFLTSIIYNTFSPHMFYPQHQAVNTKFLARPLC